jgi:cytochrome P450
MDVMEVLMKIGTPEGRANPYPLYSALHELGEAVEAGPGEVLVVGYDAISAVLRDPGFLVTDTSRWDENFPGWRDQPVFAQGADWILNLNAPDHGRIRSLLARAFTARRIAGLEPAITAMADELLDAMAERGAGGSAVEFMADFAYALPVTVICELIGIPESDRAGFRPLARDLAGVFEFSDIETLPVINNAATELLAYFTGLAARRRTHHAESLPTINAAAVELLAYFTTLAGKRRRDPRDDLLSDLVAISDSGSGRLTGAELLHNLTLLLVAGFETTTNLLGNGLNIVLNEPRAGQAVRDGSVSAAAFVEEVLRYDSPVQLTSRSGYDTKVGGVAVPAGAGVTTLLGAGNRDPRRFASPDRFDPSRPDGGPLSFGGGAHFCIGAALARLEGRVAFDRLLHRFPSISAAGDPVRRDRLVLRGFEELPVFVS